MSDLAEVIAATELLLVAVQDEMRIVQAEDDAARECARITRASLTAVRARAAGIERALNALRLQPGSHGRPRGGDPNGVNERIKALLPTRPEWSGIALREALAAEGVEVTGNRVSAALARLRQDGAAVRFGNGRWRCPG